MRIINDFSITEKVFFFTFVAIFVVSGLSLLYRVNKLFQIEVPDYGGSLTEGVIGSPRFINPLLATSDVDKDLSSLIYSGLLRTTATGELVPDLAESYEVSEDATTYTVKLKDNAYFHDGTRLTVDDVIFTIEKAQDRNLKSPRGANWDGVKIEKISENEIAFILKQPYSPFIQNLTLGILPKHIWKSASVEEFPFSQFNTKPIGSGPYKIDTISYNSSGLPTEYHLKSFGEYTQGKPFITNIIIKSYQNEKAVTDAYKNGDIQGLHSISPKQLSSLKIPAGDLVLTPLSRIFGVFFNQNVATVFVNKEVRLALETATDKQAIIDQILQGYGEPIDSPIPITQKSSNTSNATNTEDRIEKAKSILTKSGWVQNEDGVFQKKDRKGTVTLSFSISTGDAPELKETAYLLQKQWQKLGAVVEVKIFEIGDLNQDIIKTRKYDSLLFGEIIGRDLDLYPFWHSSARNSPGLNIAMYTNLKADKILENIRKTTDEETQKEQFQKFDSEIKNDIPAILTYSPYFIYIVPHKVKNISLETLTNSSERFNDVFKWYIETNNVWKIFAK
ncbi:MAG: ABC transporter substrate-binding protein [Parcubacteria group bacterium]